MPRVQRKLAENSGKLASDSRTLNIHHADEEVSQSPSVSPVFFLLSLSSATKAAVRWNFRARRRRAALKWALRVDFDGQTRSSFQLVISYTR